MAKRLILLFIICMTIPLARISAAAGNDILVCSVDNADITGLVQAYYEIGQSLPPCQNEACEKEDARIDGLVNSAFRLYGEYADEVDTSCSLRVMAFSNFKKNAKTSQEAAMYAEAIDAEISDYRDKKVVMVREMGALLQEALQKKEAARE